MKKIMLSSIIITAISSVMISCQDNKATEKKTVPVHTAKTEDVSGPVKRDGPAVASIQAPHFELKVHRAFKWSPKTEETILANMKPAAGFKFILLDMSLKNTGTETLDGGKVFIALKAVDESGKEYKKPSAALAGYLTENPLEQNPKEYNALWEKFAAGEFHREIVFAVEVPESTVELTIKLPVDDKRKEWKEVKFAIK